MIANDSKKAIGTGDEVYFELPSVDNYDAYWTVIDKCGNWMHVEIDKDGIKDNRFIELKHVKAVRKVRRS